MLVVTLGSGWIECLPLSYALIYLVVGILLGSYGFGLIEIKPNTQFLERLTEFVVIVSVFGCGLKINRPLKLWAWQSTIRLIGLLMPISIFALAAIAHYILGMGWGGAILLGAILAPTDPVLASEVQLEFTEQLEKLLEVTAIVILGTVLLIEPMLKYAGRSLLIAAFLFLVIRPLGVWLTMLGSDSAPKTRSLMGWFGIKGLGSIYYLTYALGKGFTGDTAEQVAWITYTVVVLSVVIHGVSAAPLMKWYESTKNSGVRLMKPQKIE
ncbi:MAG: cation:proton antiporter [Cyanobacteria bacterium J06553_1]